MINSLGSADEFVFRDPLDAELFVVDHTVESVDVAAMGRGEVARLVVDFTEEMKDFFLHLGRKSREKTDKLTKNKVRVGGKEGLDDLSTGT